MSSYERLIQTINEVKEYTKRAGKNLAVRCWEEQLNFEPGFSEMFHPVDKEKPEHVCNHHSSEGDFYCGFTIEEEEGYKCGFLEVQDILRKAKENGESFEYINEKILNIKNSIKNFKKQK